MLKTLRTLSVALFSILATTPSLAQVAASYPAKPIRIVVPYGAGGPIDVIARKLSLQMSSRFGQSVIVENKPGANTIIGSDLVAKSAPDGYTVLMTNTSVVQNPWLFDKLPYDAERDLKPVMSVCEAPLVLAVNASLGVSSVKALVDYERAHAGKTNYASTSIGGTTNIYGEQLKRVMALDTVHVPYKGEAPALTDLLANQVQWYFATPSQVARFAKEGTLRLLAVTGYQRLALMPEVPTMREAGFEGFETVAWYGVFVPGKTPPEIVRKLSTEMVSLARDAEMVKFLRDNAFVPTGHDVEEFSKIVSDSGKKWGEMIRRNNIRIE